MRHLLLDRVTDLVVGERARAVKNVTLTDEVLQGHFSDQPVLSSTLLLEAASQLGAFLVELSANAGTAPPRRAILVQIQQAKFHRSAEPGDQIELGAALGATLESAVQVLCEAHVKGDRLLRAALTFALNPIEPGRFEERRRELYRFLTRGLSPSPTIR